MKTGRIIKFSHHGFTLIEMMIVVAIIGIMSAIAIPLLEKFKQETNDKVALSDAKNTLTIFLGSKN